MAERRLQVTGRLGLHARAAANLVRVASQFQSSLTLQRLDGHAEADAKSILSILTLAASRGTDLKIVAHGVDEQEALDAVVSLFSRNFDEPEKADSEQFSRATKELRCKGLGVSQGIVIGRVLRLQEG
ncbi:MAG TPA: HPr family phosphocarrier protein, partial [Pyrinomonadaceae bacterium]